MLFYPIRSWDTVRKDSGDVETHFEVFPEAFRMCALLYFLCFCGIGALITTQLADTDFTDNPIIHRFGTNNICVMFDDPPFNLFGSTLWFPATVLFFVYEIFDYIRVHDHYHDGDDRYPITKGFLVYYTVSTGFECFSFIAFPQVFATAPTEYFYLHTWPYLMLIFGLFSMMLKRFLYLRRVSLVPRYGVVWVILSSISAFISVCIVAANLHHAQLWEEYPWTDPLITINNRLFTVFMIIGPMVIYGVIGEELDTVVVMLNRANPEITSPRWRKLSDDPVAVFTSERCVCSCLWFVFLSKITSSWI